MPTPKKYVFTPPGTTVYWARVATPAKIFAAGLDPKRQYRKSLNTRNLREAERLAQQYRLDLEKKWSLLSLQLEASAYLSSDTRSSPQRCAVPEIETAPREPTAITPEVIQELISRRVLSWAETDAAERDEGCSEEDIEEQQSFAKESIAQHQSVVRNGPQSKYWATCAEQALDWASDCLMLLNPSQNNFSTYVRAFSKTEVRIQSLILKINTGIENEIVEDFIPNDYSSSISSNDDKNWEIALEEYKKDQLKNISPKTVGTELNTLNSFREFIKNKKIEKVTSTDIYKFLEYKLENNEWNNNRVKRHGKNTFNKFFSLCVTLNITNNYPLETLYKLPSQSKEKDEATLRPIKPISDEQINLIFKSDWYTKKYFLKGKATNKDSGARYWIPLIMLTHGLRVREACQITLSDFIEINGISCFKITNEDSLSNSDTKLKSAKNKNTKRTIPIHPKLIELGFDKYVKKQKEKKSHFIFPSSLPDEKSKSPIIGRAFTQAFPRFLKNSLGFEKGIANHSFRHQIEDRILNSQKIGGVWPPGLGKQYMGRTSELNEIEKVYWEGSEKNYGVGHHINSIYDCIKLLDFSGINFPPPYEEWLAALS